MASHAGDVDALSTAEWIQRQKEAVAANAEREHRLAEQKKKKEKKNEQYGEDDLEGLKVGHDLADLGVGEEIILTLKDKSVLGKKKLHEIKDDDDLEMSEDELENIQMKESEKFKRVVEAKKKAKKPAYDVYNYDEDTSLLGQYDDLNDLHPKGTFRLGSEVQSSALAEAMKRKLAEDLGDLSTDGSGLPVYLGMGDGISGAGEDTGYATYSLNSDYLKQNESMTFKKKKRKANAKKIDESEDTADSNSNKKEGLTLADVTATTDDNIIGEGGTDIGSRSSRRSAATTMQKDHSEPSSSAHLNTSSTDSDLGPDAERLQRRVALSDSNYLKALKKAEEETERLIRRAAVVADNDALRGEEESEYQRALKEQREKKAAAQAEAKRQKQEFERLMKERAEAIKQKIQSEKSNDAVLVKQEHTGNVTGRTRQTFGAFSAQELVAAIGVDKDDELESTASSLLRKVKLESLNMHSAESMTDASDRMDPVKLETVDSMFDNEHIKTEVSLGEKKKYSDMKTEAHDSESNLSTSKRVKKSYHVDENASDDEVMSKSKDQVNERIFTDVDISQEGEEHFAVVENSGKRGLSGVLSRLRGQGTLSKGKLKSTSDSDDEGIHIRRTDDKGRELNTLEAWRYMSQHFHGQFSGLNKQEKLRKRHAESVKRLIATGVEIATNAGILDTSTSADEKQYKARVASRQAGIAIGGDALKSQFKQ